MAPEANDMAQHKGAFLVEAREHVATMTAALLKLEETPDDGESSHALLRASHTLKSMAAAMEYSRMTALCHALEDFLVAIRDDASRIKPGADLLFECFDFLETMLRALTNEEKEPDTQALIEKLRTCSSPNPSLAVTSETSKHQSASSPPILEPVRTIAVSVEKLDTLLNLAEEMLVSRMSLGRLKDRLGDAELSAAVESMTRLISDLQYNVMQARMVPIGFVFGRFRRMVRDLARDQNKDVKLILEDATIEVDRAMIDEVGECLVHLLRNAVDHGIESAEDRLRLGKSRIGTIQLTASRTKESAVIVVEDDGAGLDLAAVKRAGMERGLLEAEASTEEVIQAIFFGVSTTAQVTAVSGRGVGLTVAKKKIEKIGGEISVHSNPGRGTRFEIKIPLTLAVVKSLFVAVNGRTYAIPVANIDRLVTVADADFKSAMGREAFVLDGGEIPVIRLGAAFDHPSRSQSRYSIVIVRKGDVRIGVLVDALLSTEEVVVKPLNRFIRENRYFAGSALIGSGEVALVLDVSHLMMAAPSGASRRAAEPPPEKERAVEARSSPAPKRGRTAQLA